MQRDRSRIGRLLAVDVLLGLVLGAFVLFTSHAQAAAPGWGPPGPPDGAARHWSPEPLAPLAYAGIAVAAAGVMLRRALPRAALAVTSLGVLGYLLSGTPYGPIVLLLLVTVFSAATALPVRALAPWGLLIIPLVLAGFLDEPYWGFFSGDLLAAFVGGSAMLLAPATLGIILRTRREAVLRERREELRRHAYEERLSIAREVHDLVGHSLSVINMQAGVALHVLGKRPEQAAPSLEAIRQTSKDALEELRGTLAVFRDPRGASAAERAPLPGLDRLTELLTAITAAGSKARIEMEGDRAELPAAVDHAAYRIIQEALTNVVRHAAGAEAVVRVTYQPTQVIVDVTDNGPARPETPRSEGNGLAGMRERARAVGGTLSAGARPSGGFHIHAELPHGGGA